MQNFSLNKINSMKAAFLFFSGGLLSGCLQSSPSSIPISLSPTVVEIQKIVEQSSYAIPRRFIGIVQSQQRANLGSEINGKVTQIWVDIGSKIEKGMPLLALDTQLLQLEEKQRQAKMAQINADLTFVDRSLLRQEQLKRKGFTADAEIDQLNSQKASLLAQRQQVNFSLESNRLQQQKATIISPYSGVISERHVSVGDVINIGTPTLTIHSDQQTEANIGVPIQYAESVKKNPNLTVVIGQHTYSVKQSSFSKQVDPSTRTVNFKFKLPHHHNRLEGEFVYLDHSEIRKKSGYWIPLTALSEGKKGIWTVFSVESDNNHQKVIRHAVQVLYVNQQQAFISASFKPEMTFIIHGSHRLVAGQTVTIKASSPSPSS
jgi:RND family efflux transporter MFP subunit